MFPRHFVVVSRFFKISFKLYKFHISLAFLKEHYSFVQCQNDGGKFWEGGVRKNDGTFPVHFSL